MGSLSYELYLSHMFVVLGAVALYRAALGKEQAWTFTVYVPVLLLCIGLALVLERLTARAIARRIVPVDRDVRARQTS
jgi:peptidoglycan/LPS O-acetylase OafA/YrhL